MGRYEAGLIYRLSVLRLHAFSALLNDRNGSNAAVGHLRREDGNQPKAPILVTPSQNPQT